MVINRRNDTTQKLLTLALTVSINRHVLWQAYGTGGDITIGVSPILLAIVPTSEDVGDAVFTLLMSMRMLAAGGVGVDKCRLC